MLAERLETEIKYAGYIARQDRMIRDEMCIRDRIKAAVDYLREVIALMGVENVTFSAVQKGEDVYKRQVVVTVVGGGELVENPEKSCRNAGVLVSTGL